MRAYLKTLPFVACAVMLLGLAAGMGTPDCPGDLNNDGSVNATDLATLLGAWGSNPGHPADLNGDGSVNASDLASLLGNWGLCAVCSSSTECDDGEFCNGPEQCLVGRCEPGSPPNCSDADPCTADTCEPGEGCVHTAGAPCNNDCIDATTISNGSTAFNTTGATTDGVGHSGCQHDGQTYNDIWYHYTATCNGELTVSTCDAADFDTDLVIYTGCNCGSMTLADCNDDAEGCSDFSSEAIAPVTVGGCYTVRVGGFSIADTGSGTLTLTCTATCVTNADCDDGNVCTTDVCNAGSVCVHNSNSLACNDGLFCNGSDTCSGGSCSIHSGNPCAGGSQCANTCNEQADNCLNPAGTLCGSGADTDCDDPDTCNGNGVCLANNAPNGSACSDGLFCNGTDTCISGACNNHSGNPCAGPDGDSNCAESCNETTDNCTAADPNGSACNDGLFCNGADTCSGGSCSGHAGSPCPGPDGDGNCAESCNEAADNCVAADPNGSACNDGLFCNGADTCSGGSCSGHAGNPCPGPDNDSNCAESCNEAADNCTALDPNGSTCNDGLFCNGIDTCSAGACSVHPGNPCSGQPFCANQCNETLDTCNRPAGTACGSSSDTNCDNPDTCDGNGVCAANNESNGVLCFNGDFCDGSDTCQSGVCTGTGPDPNCNDGNPCTLDTCDAKQGCIHTPNCD